MAGALSLCAQAPVDITIIHDDDRGMKEYMLLVKEEIDVLLSRQYDINYNEVNVSYTGKSPIDVIQSGLSDDADVLITLGFTSSSALSSIEEYTKPCISGISLERITGDQTGINNYTLVQSPFSIAQDFRIFQFIHSFKHLAIFVQPNIQRGMQLFLDQFANGFDIQFLPITDNPTADLNRLNEDVDAIYFLPNLYKTESSNQALIDGINDRKLPSFSLIGRADVERGILASNAPSNYISIYARRIALNVMKILEGENAKDLPIEIGGVEDDLVINVATMEQLGIYPPFSILNNASLIELDPKLGEQYTLQSALAEALNNNLSIQSAAKNVDIQKTEIDIAKSNLLPNLSVNSNLVTLDGSTSDQLAAANQLTPQTIWTGNVGLTQLIYSQPAWANVAIQKSLLHSEEAGLMSQQLDLTLDVCIAYLSILQAQANLNIQNTNVQTTLSNLNIAKTKAKIGTLSNADVFGFESQLALNKTRLNDAIAGVENARIRFNQLLNRPLDADFMLKDIQLDDDVFYLQDIRLTEGINNQYDFRKLAEFLIKYTMQNAPAIEQLRWAIKAQESSLESNKKSRSLPQIALKGNLDKTFGRYGTKVSDEVFEAIGIDPYKPTWNLGVNVSLPLFQGNIRNKKIEKDQILIEQLEINRASLEQQFAANIRQSLENLGNSFSDIRFNEQAEKSGNQYLGVVQNLYREGASNIVTLLDAQNSALSAQLGAVSSRYQFIIDAITIERIYNNIYLLATPQERETFINDYFAFLIKKENNE